MANITLPASFKEKLESNQYINGIVNSTLSTFGDILQDNKLYFFEEYTDHGIAHIEQVLEASAIITTDNTINKVLSDTDISFYVLAVILHDIGMHIRPEGLKFLLDGGFDYVRVKEFDDKTWKELWQDYLREAKRFSGKQLKSIFNDENTIIRVPPIDDIRSLNNDDRKLIGEFIRRYHARLAHEIAIAGYPRANSTLEFANGLEEKDRNIIGLIARSHSMNLRTALDYIEKDGIGKRAIVQGSHAIFLMVLLRIADYLQIDKTRTSKVLIKLRTFSSPYSLQEHYAHLSIDHVHFEYHSDPERVFVECSPKDSSMFLKLDSLIKDIQKELDMSWAVLGELYGKEKELKRPGLKYRRIKSNLENREYVNKLNFIADSFSFKANDEITKLLIAPLYGDDPTYGVRELLQNAIDACHERELIEIKNKDNYRPYIKVEVNKKDGKCYFQITDNGIGMDLYVLKNYFFSAGASYRKSLEWQKKFVDDEGHAKVRRSGRFGVGILAAFLIGDVIEVYTKKSGDNGYYMSTRLNSEQINIIKSSTDYGTTIKIVIDNDTYEKLSPMSSRRSYDSPAGWYEWYVYNTPLIEYYYNNEKVESYEKFDPSPLSKLPDDWNVIKPNGYEKVFWTYSKNYTDVNLTCNGIVIDDNDRFYRSRFGTSNFKEPKIGVIDNDGMLPLSLDRSTLTDTPSYYKDLLIEIIKDFIAYVLTVDNIMKVTDDRVIFGNSYLQYVGLYSQQTDRVVFREPNAFEDSPGLTNIYFTKEGFFLGYKFFVNKIKPHKVLFIQSDNFSRDYLEIDIQDYVLNFSSQKINSIDDYKGLFDKSFLMGTISSVFIKKAKYRYLFDEKKERINQWYKSRLSVNDSVQNWINLQLIQTDCELINPDFLIKYAEDINVIKEDQMQIGEPLLTHSTELDSLLERYLGDDVIIPYDLEERKEKYPLAFKELKRYMQKYLKG